MTKVITYGSLERNSVSNGYILELLLNQSAPDISRGTSQVEFTLRLRSGGCNRFADYGVGAQVRFDGVQVGNRDRLTAPRVSLGYNSVVTLLSGSAPVVHDADGSKILTVDFSISMASGIYVPGSVTVSNRQVELTPIVGVSTVGASDCRIGSACAISLGRRLSDTCHTIKVEFGALSGYIGADWQFTHTPAKLTDTAISFPVPEVFYQQIPNSSTGKCTLTVVTYRGDTPLGSSKAEFTLGTNPDVCAPEATLQVQDINPRTLALTGDNKKLVRFCSTARCTVEAQGRHGAQITQILVNGQPLGDLENVQTGDISCTVTDSRGYTAEDKDTEISLIPYVLLTANPVCKRTDPVTGTAALTVTGDWFSGSFGKESNTLTLRYQLDGGAWAALEPVPGQDSYTAQCQIPSVDYRREHTLTVVAADALTQVTKTVTLGRGEPVFDWSEKDFCFRVPVSTPSLTVAQKLVADHPVELGQQGNWQFCRFASGYTACWGRFSHSCQCNSTAGGLFAAQEEIPAQQYPVTFAEAPVVQVSLQAPALLLPGQPGTNTHTGTYTFLAPVAGQVQGEVSYFAIGKEE